MMISDAIHQRDVMKHLALAEYELPDEITDDAQKIKLLLLKKIKGAIDLDTVTIRRYSPTSVTYMLTFESPNNPNT